MELLSSCFPQRIYKRNPSVYKFAVTVILVGTLFGGVSCEDEEGIKVVLDPPRLAVEVNSSVDPVKVRCNLTNLPPDFHNSHDVSATWYDPNGVDLRNSSSSRFNVSDDDSTFGDVILTIQATEEDDSGTYTCTVTVTDGPSGNSTETYSGTFDYIAYVMPTYLKEGMIILGVNLALAAVFVGCLTRSMLADKRRLAKYGRVASSG